MKAEERKLINIQKDYKHYKLGIYSAEIQLAGTSEYTSYEGEV
jgi:hypothetical protein